MTVKGMREFLATMPDDARFVIWSIEDPRAGLVDIALLYDTSTIEVCEMLGDEEES